MFRTACLTCESTQIVPVLDLGMHPTADTFVPLDRSSEPDHLHPLQVDLCTGCGQVQLRAIVSPEERYQRFDYSYTSSNSATSRNHWVRYADSVAARIQLPKGALVVEVGSNDGFLLEQFRDHGCQVLGVDASPAVGELARQRGIKTVVGLFGTESARHIREEVSEAPLLICANNVFNHANDPVDFARGVQELLAPGGTFVFELPYWLTSIQQGKYDQVYHEHVSYLSVTHAVSLFKLAGLVVTDVEEVDYHGGSIRVFVQHEGSPSPTVEIAMAKEKAAGLFDPAMYATFQNGILRQRTRFLQKLYTLKTEGASVVCVGAAAKGNTFLNFHRLDANTIDFVSDASPLKIGKLTPGSRIPIRSDEALRPYDKVFAIVTSWNLYPVLKESLAKINPSIEFLNPYDHDF